jgi:hypothetical protein
VSEIRDAALSRVQTFARKPLVGAGAKAARGAPPPEA